MRGLLITENGIPVGVKWHPNLLSSMKRLSSFTALLIWLLARPLDAHRSSQWLLPLWALLSPRPAALLHGGPSASFSGVEAFERELASLAP
jgi:hypothetical protein